MKIDLFKISSGGRVIRPLTKLESSGNGKEKTVIFEDEKGVQFKVIAVLSDAEVVHGMPWVQ